MHAIRYKLDYGQRNREIEWLHLLLVSHQPQYGSLARRHAEHWANIEQL